MARPSKKGLAYFPLDTTFLNDRKTQRLLLEYGCEGVAVLCEIYATNGYYTLRTKQIHPAYRITNKLEVFVTETTVIATETPVIVTETPVIVTKTPTNINTNKKEIKIQNKIQIQTNQKQTLKTTTTYGNQSENDNTESARRAQLLQMAAEATANKRDA